MVIALIARPLALKNSCISAAVLRSSVHDRQIRLRRRQDDEAPVDPVRIQIVAVADFLGDFG